MKWTESATKHWSTRTAVSNTEILSPPNKYTFWTASIWHGTWHIHLWKVLQSRSYCIGCISPLSRYIVWMHSRPTRMQSSIWWLHSCIAQLHTLNTVLIAQCRVQLSAHYAQLYHAQRYQACARYHARRYRAVLTKNLESFPLLLLLLTASPAWLSAVLNQDSCFLFFGFSFFFSNFVECLKNIEISLWLGERGHKIVPDISLRRALQDNLIS